MVTEPLQEPVSSTVKKIIIYFLPSAGTFAVRVLSNFDLLKVLFDFN